MHVQKSPAGARGVDTIERFTVERARAFRAAGYSFAVRYLGNLLAPERDAILSGGLALLAVNYSRRPGWRPSSALGAADGALAVAHAEQAGLLPGMTLWLDLEGPSGTGVDCIGWVNAAARAIQRAHFKAGLYVGYGVPLSADQLYWSLAVTAYWDSCSVNPSVSRRGFQMRQLSPPNQWVCGTHVDLNVIQTDALGDTPHWLAPEVTG